MEKDLKMKIDLTVSLLQFIKELVTSAYQRAAEAERHPAWKLHCPKLPDIDFVLACIVRGFSKVDSGLDFLQHYEQVYGIKLCRSNWFNACSSPRRCQMLEAVSPFFQIVLKEHMASLGNNYLENLPGVERASVNAYDGHFMRRSVHSETEDKDATKTPTAGFIFGIDLSCGLLEPLKVVSDGSRTQNEIPYFKEWYEKLFVERKISGMRITVYDRAMAEFKFWANEAKAERYIVTRSKTSFRFDAKKILTWDKHDSINEGVLSDSMMSKKVSGRNAKFRVIKYYDPVHDHTYSFLTTLPTTVAPGVVAELYRRRWQIEKVFDNTKNDLKELKGWGKSKESLIVQMHVIAAVYNLMRLFHEMNIVENPKGTHESQEKHESRCESIEEQLKAQGLKLNPLFAIGHLMRLSCKTIRSFQNFLITQRPIKGLFKALKQEIRM